MTDFELLHYQLFRAFKLVQLDENFTKSFDRMTGEKI